MIDLQLIARVIEAEASVLPYLGKLAVAQCIRDNQMDFTAFTEPAGDYSEESMQAAVEVFLEGKKRFSGYKLLQFRSFGKYGPGGVPDWDKLYGGEWPIPDNLFYLGKDGDGQWGHYYFGRRDAMSNFRFLIMAGHGRNADGTFDPGAIGNGYREADLIRRLVPRIKAEADRQGILADIAPDRNHFTFFRDGGVYDVTPYNYVIEIHLNAGGEVDVIGDGVRKGSMFYIDASETGQSVEEAILRNLYAIGSRKAWDGVVVTQRQWSNGLMVQNHIRAQGVSHAVLETCFISDKDDVAWFLANLDAIAKAIVDGIREGFGLRKPFEPYMVRVAISDLNIRTAPTVDAASVGRIAPGAYTIVEEVVGKVDKATGAMGLWGKLKSGAGYIALMHTNKI